MCRLNPLGRRSQAPGYILRTPSNNSLPAAQQAFVGFTSSNAAEEFEADPLKATKLPIIFSVHPELFVLADLRLRRACCIYVDRAAPSQPDRLGAVVTASSSSHFEEKAKGKCRHATKCSLFICETLALTVWPIQ